MGRRCRDKIGKGESLQDEQGKAGKTEEEEEQEQGSRASPGILGAWFSLLVPAHPHSCSMLHGTHLRLAWAACCSHSGSAQGPERMGRVPQCQGAGRRVRTWDFASEQQFFQDVVTA